MPILSRKEILELCEKNKGSVAMAVKRGNLIQDDSRKIDTSIEHNRIFLKKWLFDAFPENIANEKMKIISYNFSEEKKEPTPKKEKPLKSTRRRNKEPENKTESDSESLEVLKKRAELEFKKSQAELNQLKIKTLKGENIPTDLVVKVFSILGKSFLTSYKNGSKNFVQDVAHKTRMSIEDKSYMESELVKVINQSHKDSLDLAKKELRSVIDTVLNNVLNSDEDE